MGFKRNSIRDRRRAATTFGVVEIVFAVLVACNTHRVSKADIEAMIGRELQTGCTVADVLRFLDSRGIKHFGYEEGPEPIFAPTPTQPSPEIKRFVLAKVPNIRRTALASWDLYVFFFFDEAGTMTDHKMKEIGTGP
jgi:hypothetical protein